MTRAVQVDRSKLRLGVTSTLSWNDDYVSTDTRFSSEHCVSEMKLVGGTGIVVRRRADQRSPEHPRETAGIAVIASFGRRIAGARAT